MYYKYTKIKFIFFKRSVKTNNGRGIIQDEGYLVKQINLGFCE